MLILVQCSRALRVFGLMLLLSVPASAVTIDWTPVGDPGNACDTQSQGCFGAVGYDFEIATYEVTNAQYAAFLNSVADTDANALYDANMGTGLGGIARSGSSGSYSYSAITGREALPVNYVSWHDALRFANWLHNGQLDTGAQSSATTEDGSYTFSGTTTVGGRNAGATIVLPDENEWYKAAYYAGGVTYFDYPAGFDVQTICATPTALPNTATCNASGGGLQDVGSYTGAASPYGTFDQGGNVWEWTETADGATQVMRGGSYATNAANLAAASRVSNFAGTQDSWFGFRVASVQVPEPGTGLLLGFGLLVFSGSRRLGRG